MELTKKYWEIVNQLKKINDITRIIKIFIDNKSIITIEQFNETIEKSLKDEIEKLNQIIK